MMLPSLTPTGTSLLGGCSAALVLGTVLGVPEALRPAMLGVAVVAWAYLRALAALRSVERGRLTVEVASELGGDLALLLGQTSTLHVRAQTDAALGARVRLNLEMPGSVTVERDARWAIVSGPSRVELSARVTGQHIGRWPIGPVHVELVDALGLAGASAWVQTPGVVRVVPSVGARVASRRATQVRLEQADEGADLVLRKGDGSELREIRPWQSGDAFGRIAWKSTARTGELMVREHEEEAPGALLILLDISSTMRAGAELSKLDWALTAAGAMIRAGLARRDRVGIASFDDAVRGSLAPAVGPRHGELLMQHLVMAPIYPGEGVLEPDDDAIEAAVLQWVRRVQRLELGARGVSGTRIDPTMLEAWLRRAPEVLDGLDRELADAGFDPTTVHVVRRVATAYGVPLAPRREPRFGGRDAGLIDALGWAVDQRRARSTLVVLTDLAAVVEAASVANAAGGAVAARHSVTFVVPWTPAFVGLASPDRALADAFGVLEQAERRRIAEALRGQGARVIFVEPSDGAGEVAGAALSSVGRSR